MVEVIKFVPDRRAIQNLLHGRDGMVALDLHKRALRVLAAAQRQVGVDTGRLRRSLHIEHTYRPVTSALIGSNVRYALLHHEGSRPHVITPKEGRMLVFQSGGRRVYARKVMHPGTRANKFLTDNLLRAVR